MKEDVMTLQKYLDESLTNKNLFWELNSGEHMNLLYEALDKIQRLEDKIAEKMITIMEIRENIIDFHVNTEAFCSMTRLGELLHLSTEELREFSNSIDFAKVQERQFKRELREREKRVLGE